MNKKSYVLVEFIGESGEWVWYAVYSNATPKEALKQYAREMLDWDKGALPTEIDCGVLYLKEDNARAQFIEVLPLA